MADFFWKNLFSFLSAALIAFWLIISSLCMANDSWTFKQASAALEILTEGQCTPPLCVLVFLGRSNGPIQALANANGLDVINFPITNFRYNPNGFESYPSPYDEQPKLHKYLDPLGNSESQVLNSHFDKFFREKLIAGAKEFRIVDVSVRGGFSQLAIQSYLRRYLASISAESEVIAYPLVPRIGLKDDGLMNPRDIESMSPQRILQIAPLYGIHKLRLVPIDDRFHNKLNNQDYPAAVGKLDLFDGNVYEYPQLIKEGYDELVSSMASLSSTSCARIREILKEDSKDRQ